MPSDFFWTDQCTIHILGLYELHFKYTFGHVCGGLYWLHSFYSNNKAWQEEHFAKYYLCWKKKISIINWVMWISSRWSKVFRKCFEGGIGID